MTRVVEVTARSTLVISTACSVPVIATARSVLVISTVAFSSRHFDWRRSRNGEISFLDLSVEALAPQVEDDEGGRFAHSGRDDGDVRNNLPVFSSP